MMQYFSLKHSFVYHSKTLRVYSYEEEYPESKNFRKLDLKVEMEGDLLISMGIVFHDLVDRFYPILLCVLPFNKNFTPSCLPCAIIMNIRNVIEIIIKHWRS